MRRFIASLAVVACVALVFTATSRSGRAQQTPAPRPTIAQSDHPPAFPLSRIEDMFIQFPLPRGEEKYGSIDGRKMHKLVVEQVGDLDAVSRCRPSEVLGPADRIERRCRGR